MYYNPEARREIKGTAKARVCGRFWPAMLACAACTLPKLLSALIFPLAGLDALSGQIAAMVSDAGASMPQVEALYNTFMARFGLVLLLMAVIDLLLTGPLYMGLKRYLLALYRGGQPELSETMYCFSGGAAYWRSFKANLWVWLYSLLWGLLLIPGALVMLVLSMLNILFALLGAAGYIFLAAWVMTKLQTFDGAYNLLCDDPGMQPRQAIRIMPELFRGRLWELFVFIFSFLGWIAVCGLPGYLLTYLGFGLLGTVVDFVLGLFVVAYRGAAFMGYVEALRDFWKQEYEKGGEGTPVQ